jgi:hypothetical protein
MVRFLRARLWARIFSILAPWCLLVIFHASKHIRFLNLWVLAPKIQIQLCWFWSSLIYPMEVGYIRLDPAATVLEPGRWSDITNASDIFALGQIYLTWSPCQGSGPRPEAKYVWYIGYVHPRSDISGLEIVQGPGIRWKYPTWRRGHVAWW